MASALVENNMDRSDELEQTRLLLNPLAARYRQSQPSQRYGISLFGKYQETCERSVEGTQIENGSSYNQGCGRTRARVGVGKDLAWGTQQGAETQEAAQQSLALPYLQSPLR
jgi:hypothetical protein